MLVLLPAVGSIAGNIVLNKEMLRMNLDRCIPWGGMPRCGTAGKLPEVPKPSAPKGMSEIPPMMPFGSKKNIASPPKRDPRTDPDARPGGDVLPDAPAGPGFPGGGPPKTPPFERVESIDIIDGKYLPCEMPYALWDGTVCDAHMTQVHYQTDTPCLNGVYIGGSSVYQINQCSFKLDGYGINDFAGIGSAVMTDGTSRVVIRDTELVTSGALRSCITADGTSTVTLENCRLYAAGGALPEGYRPRIGAGMMEPPPGMRIGGTCRASVLLSGAKMYYNNCVIQADGWGALSTDSDAPGKYLKCDDCKIILSGSGYGIFGDGSVVCEMNRCSFDVKDYVSMSGASSCIRFTDCSLTSEEYGAMVFGSGAFRVPQLYFQGGKIDAKEAAVYLKGTNAYVSMNHVEVSRGEYFIHTIVDDDSMQSVLQEDERFQTYGMKVALRDMTVCGDIVHEEIRRDLAVTMEHVQYTGKIEHAYLSLQESSWFATGDSTVALVGDVYVEAIDAPKGVTIRAVAAEGCRLKGDYPLPSGGRLSVTLQRKEDHQ